MVSALFMGGKFQGEIANLQARREILVTVDAICNINCRSGVACRDAGTSRSAGMRVSDLAAIRAGDGAPTRHRYLSQEDLIGYPADICTELRQLLFYALITPVNVVYPVDPCFPVRHQSRQHQTGRGT